MINIFLEPYYIHTVVISNGQHICLDLGPTDDQQCPLMFLQVVVDNWPPSPSDQSPSRPAADNIF